MKEELRKLKSDLNKYSSYERLFVQGPSQYKNYRLLIETQSKLINLIERELYKK